MAAVPPPAFLEIVKMKINEVGCSTFSNLQGDYIISVKEHDASGINPSQGFVILQPILSALTASLCSPNSTIRLLPSSPPTCAMMKLHATAAAAVCVVLLLVASEMAVTSSEAAGCDIFQMVPCMAAAKNAKVAPSRQCCANIASMGVGVAGAKCLCSLLSNPLAKSNGVVPSIALTLPHKCRIAVPKGFVCQGIRVPGS